MTDDKPSDGATMERAISLSREYICAVRLQKNRLQKPCSEEYSFQFKYCIDLQFFIISLYRFRNMVNLATKIDSISKYMCEAIEEFDRNIPDLKIMRDVGEHMYDYGIDSKKRHVREINRKDLQADSFSVDMVFTWLGKKLNVNSALNEAEKLYEKLQSIKEEMGQNKF